MTSSFDDVFQVVDLPDVVNLSVILVNGTYALDEFATACAVV
jgi:hypothetical protein